MMILYPSHSGDASGESGNESSCEDEVIPLKLHKPVQVRHSLLDNLDEASKPTTEPPSKRQKREDNAVSCAIR